MEMPHSGTENQPYLEWRSGQHFVTLEFPLCNSVLCDKRRKEKPKHSVCLTRRGTNSSVSPWCLGSYSFIIKDFGQSTVVVIIT